MNHFCLVQAVDRFSQRVIVAVAPAANRRLDTCFGQPFQPANVIKLPAGLGKRPAIPAGRPAGVGQKQTFR
jgi:hypothetical protein